MTEVLKRHKVIVLLAILGLSYIGYAAYWNLNNPIKPQTTASIASEMAKQQYTPEDWLKEVNKKRVEAGIRPLKLDKRLNASAAKKVQELDSEDDKDGNPHTNNHGVHGYTYALNAAGCSYASENIAPFDKTPQKTVDLWMHSKPHRAAILDPRYKTSGFSWSATTAVEHFCS